MEVSLLQKKRSVVACKFALSLVPIVIGTQALAFNFELDNPDFDVRWDNTVKYNYASRVRGRDQKIASSPNYNDGDLNFSKGTVSNRLDLLSEFDFIYKRNTGFRISATAWGDEAYTSLDNNNPSMSNHIVGGLSATGLSSTTSRYHKGVSGEILDAFVFTKLDLGEMPLNLRFGRHTLYWGESVLSPVHGISYGQSSLDLIKGYSVPGTEAKELMMPRNALSAQLQATPELTLAAQYFLDWKPMRLPEAGSYLGFYDYVMEGGESLFGSPLLPFYHGQDIKPKKQGDWGFATRWSPAEIDTTFGLYYRKLTDMFPQANLQIAALPNAMLGGACPLIPGAILAGPNCLIYPQLSGKNAYTFSYGSDVDVIGLSASKNIAGISFSTELSYRKNMPLVSDPVFVMPAGTSPLVMAGLASALPYGAVATTMPSAGEVLGARGNTYHGVLTAIGNEAKSPLYDAASWIVELIWSRWDKVTQGEQFFRGRNSYVGIDKVTKDYFGLAANFTPTWYQVAPSVDLTLPISFSAGLSGNSAVTAGGSENAGMFSIGIGADIQQRYKFDLKYVGFFGGVVTNSAGQISSASGASALLRDRGFVAATFKTTF